MSTSEVPGVVIGVIVVLLIDMLVAWGITIGMGALALHGFIGAAPSFTMVVLVIAIVQALLAPIVGMLARGN